MRPADRARLLRLSRMAQQRGTLEARDNLVGYVDGLIADAVESCMASYRLTQPSALQCAKPGCDNKAWGSSNYCCAHPPFELVDEPPTWGEKFRAWWRRLHT